MDRDGKPVSGAKLELISVDMPDGSRVNYSCNPFREHFLIETTADGRWRVGGVPTFGTAMVRLNDPRFVSRWSEAQLGTQAGSAPPIIARPGATVTGKVIYEDGKPAPGIMITAGDLDLGTGYGLTKPDGSYVVRSLASGSIQVSATDRSRVWVAPPVRNLRVSEGTTTKAPEIVLTRGAQIVGQVIEEGTGRARPDMSIQISGERGDWWSDSSVRAQADKRGFFSARVAPGKKVIQVFDPDCYGRVEEPVRVTLAKGETRRVTIKLRKEVIATGRLLDQQGNPIAGQRVRIIVVVDEHNNNMGGTAVTNQAGVFVVHNLVAGKATITAGRDMSVMIGRSFSRRASICRT